ncbi:MAG: hypothetical protein EAZ79_24570 [Oscillatoriales cyanobacterium]|nr:MAG: hypothetical protein EAZ79_24570 [Oscillatoriales cyanobacterium]
MRAVPKSRRHYTPQRISNSHHATRHPNYRFDDLRLYLDGYLAALRHCNSLEPYLIHRLEEEAARYIHDPSNFEMPQTQTQAESDYY